MREELVTIQGEYELAGTMTVPAKACEMYPAVLILPGTGKSDRDGNRGGLDMNLYKDIAAFLTGLGVVTLRFDKRGTYESKGDADARGMWDMVDDGAACLRFLKEHPLVDETRVFILGHSEGTILGPAVHRQEVSAGLILLSGGAMCLRDILIWQRQQAYAALQASPGLKGWLIRTLRVAEKGEKKSLQFEEKVMKSDRDMMRVLWQKFPAKWMREHYHYNVADDMVHVHVPVLLITGEKDVQVPLAAVQRAAELAQGEKEVHVIPGMTHILKRWDGIMDGGNPLKVYKAQAEQPLQAELLLYIEQWLSRFAHPETVAWGEETGYEAL